MAKVGARKSAPRPLQRVSPLKPGLSGARNWATAQVRAASYSRQGFVRLSLTLLFALCFLVFGALWLGGFMPNAKAAGADFTRARLISMGFVVKRVDVMGEGRLRESEVRQTLGIAAGDFLFDLDTHAAQDRIEQLSWVDHAVVRRLWPNRVVVQLVERRPYALWQFQGTVQVVDATGQPIQDAAFTDYTHLPLMVGADAARYAADIQTALAHFPDLQERVEAAVRMNSEQWRLRFLDGAFWVQIPHQNLRAALAQLNALQADHQVLDRQIANIDLRIKGRIAITPSTDPRA